MNKIFSLGLPEDLYKTLDKIAIDDQRPRAGYHYINIDHIKMAKFWVFVIDSATQKLIISLLFGLCLLRGLRVTFLFWIAGFLMLFRVFRVEMWS